MAHKPRDNLVSRDRQQLRTNGDTRLTQPSAPAEDPRLLGLIPDGNWNESSDSRLQQNNNKTRKETSHPADAVTAADSDQLGAAQLRVIINRFGMLELDLSNRNLRNIPDAVFVLTRLEVLRLSRNRLRVVPPAISGLRNLRHLDIGNNELDALPDSLATCSRLVELDARSNRLTSIPKTLPGGLLRHLRSIRLAGNRIEQLPVDFGRLKELRRIDFSSNRLRDLPPSISDLVELNVLNLSDNGFDRLPVGICRLAKLETLDLSKNQLSTLPDDFDRLRRLRELRLASNRFDTIPDSLCRTSSLAIINVSDNSVTSLPVGLASLPRLVELDVRRNAIDRFPEVATGWPCLERLNISGNRLRSLAVGPMTRLRRLDVDQNWLSELPQGLHRLTSSLESLNIGGNRITHLTADVALLKKLRVLDVSNNLLQMIPKAVELMPGLETFDVSGNNPLLRNPRTARTDNTPPTAEQPLAYVIDRRSGPPPPGAIPLVFTKTKSGLLYATPMASVPLVSRPNGHNSVNQRLSTGAVAAVSSSTASSATSSSGKQSSGGVLGLFRMRKKSTAAGGRKNGSGSGSGGSSDKKMGLNSGTLTTTTGLNATGSFPFPLSPSDLVSPTSLSVITGRGINNGAIDRSSNKNRRNGNTDSLEFNGHDLDIASNRLLASPTRSLSIGDLQDFDSIGTVRLETSERPSKPQPWRSTIDLGSAEGDRRLFYRSPRGHRRNSEVDDDGRCSDTVTINEEVGDRLSLGDDDFEFLPPNVHDAKLLRIAGDLETLLNKQLLDPIIDGRPDDGGRSGGRRGAEATTEERRGRMTSMENANGAKSNSLKYYSDSRMPRVSSSTFADNGHRKLPNGTGDNHTASILPSPTETIRPWDAFGAPVDTIRRDTAAVVNFSDIDTFVVGRRGGLFRSTANQDISFYVPSEALNVEIKLSMQVISIAAEMLDEPTIIAIGDIVTLHDVTSGVLDRSLRQHVTVTVPVPRVILGSAGRTGGLGAGKLHVLTYRGDGSTDTWHGGLLPSTCQPCVYDHSTSRRGVVSIRAWHFTGLGVVLSKTGNSFAACRSMDGVLRRLNERR